MGLSSKQVSNDMNCWNQDLLEGERIVEFPNTSPIKTPQQQQQQQQQAPPEKLNCPRCDSTNTKFCYYNNYNKSQPRHFCKACKRHWTKGGTLRNVPVGGGRKNKRLKPSKTVSKTTTITTNNNNNNNIASTLQSQQLRDSLPLGGSFYQNFLKQQQESSINFTSKGSNYANFLGPTTKNTSLALSTQNHDHHQEVQFPYSNYGSFESNPCSISSTITSIIQSPILYNFTGDQVNNEGLLENDHHQHQPWNMHASTTRNNTNNIVMDMMSSNSNWGWDDIDKYVSVEADITVPWDDNAEIKP